MQCMGQQTLLVYSSQLSYSNRTVSFAMHGAIGSQNTKQVIVSALAFMLPHRLFQLYQLFCCIVKHYNNETLQSSCMHGHVTLLLYYVTPHMELSVIERMRKCVEGGILLLEDGLLH